MASQVTSLRPLASWIASQQPNNQMANMQTYSQIRRMKSTGPLVDDIVVNIQDEADYEKLVLDSPVPVVIDFHATWCGPCKLLGPRLEAMVGAMGGKVRLAKIDVDDLQELAMQFTISSIPTVIGMKNKKVQDKFIGLMDDDKIETFLEKLAE